jgi:hypothetical protein
MARNSEQEEVRIIFENFVGKTGYRARVAIRRSASIVHLDLPLRVLIEL